jgi:hypothetical protein
MKNLEILIKAIKDYRKGLIEYGEYEILVREAGYPVDHAEEFLYHINDLLILAYLKNNNL